MKNQNDDDIEPGTRDLFAAMAMMGFIANGYLDGAQNYDQAESQLARDCYAMADAMLKARQS